jgi:diguanylate cyclase (GGDEF)-like protein
MLIEIEGFDAICEQYGHSVGDDVLRATAGRLHFELRKTDTAVRLDRGQFAAMLVDLQEAGQAQVVAAKVAQALSAPVNVGVARLPLVARVGVVWSPAHGNQLLPLLQAAEAALASLPAGQGGVAAGQPS